MQAESNVCQACLNGIAEAQPLFCKEHFISCFTFCSFVLSYDSDEVGAFVEVEGIDHVGAAVRPADGVVEGDAQDACRLVHLEIHTVQVHTRNVLSSFIFRSIYCYTFIILKSCS